uniref:PiggyBac transposable element-derived protein domain-containing protein n=1 Tax=Sinocyclocheilus grahami TaxID=75366 RepID=A0A672KG02_SINGR
MTSQLIYFMYITCFSHNLPLEYKVIDFLEHLVNGELSDLDLNREEDDHEQMTITRKHEIKWRHRPFATIIDTSFQNHLIYDRHPMSPYEYFKQFVLESLFDLMFDSTNIYAMQSGTLGFKPTSSGEIRTLIGLHLAMGVMKMPRVSMYWELRSHLHLVNNLERPAENNDVFYKVCPLYDAMRRRCLELPLEENLCVDEQMVPFHGSLSVKQYVKGATMELYFDNYFMTYNLLELFAEKKIHATGTARVCRFANPPLQSDKVMAKMPRGSCDEAVRSCDEAVSRDGKVTLVKWFDSRSVVMASNVVGVGTMDEVQRWDKKQGRFLKVSRPEVVKLYNEAMGGVDLLNQFVSLYRTEIRSRESTLRMITHAFDLAVVNSWLEYRLDAKRANLQTKDTLDLLHFKMNVAQCLVSDARPLPEVQYDMVDHMPNYDEKTEATKCTRPYCTGKTHAFCDKCNIHL